MTDEDIKDLEWLYNEIPGHATGTLDRIRGYSPDGDDSSGEKVNREASEALIVLLIPRGEPVRTNDSSRNFCPDRSASQLACHGSVKRIRSHEVFHDGRAPS